MARFRPNPTPAIKGKHRRVKGLAVNHRVWEIMHFELLIHAGLRFGMADDQPATRRKRFVEPIDYLLRRGLIKILGNGEIDRALTVRAHKFSESARAKIEASGGSTEIIPVKVYEKTKRREQQEQTQDAKA